MINIYLIKNKINNKIYIGKTKKKIEIRFHEHHKSAKRNDTNSILHKAIRKYGIDNFEIKLICFCNNNIANENEKKYINENNSFYPHGYNLTKGGDGGLWTEKRKKRFSEYQKIIGNKPEERKQRSIRNIERYKDPKEREKTGEKAKNRKWINDGGINKFVNQNELDNYISNGWIIGKIDFGRKNKIVVNNGKMQKWINEDELDSYINRGWIQGGLKLKKKYAWINKDGKQKRVEKEKLFQYKDWELGRK
jgi:group I intron endonuclease